MKIKDISQALGAETHLFYVTMGGVSYFLVNSDQVQSLCNYMSDKYKKEVCPTDMDRAMSLFPSSDA
jgi:hypothetical protein